MISPLLVMAALLGIGSPLPVEDAKPIKILFWATTGTICRPSRFRDLQPVMARRGIELTYTDSTGDLNAQTLAGYDGLMIYANTTRITPEQEKALLDYVEQGHGFIPLHCASYCFLNSPKYVALVGAQFLKHATGIVRTEIAQPDHPVMKGFKPFSSWDETYVHTKHNERDRVVLEIRQENGVKEPWTWVRTQGKGRIFYTAWGHDQPHLEPTWISRVSRARCSLGDRWRSNRRFERRDSHCNEPRFPRKPFKAPEMTGLASQRRQAFREYGRRRQEDSKLHAAEPDLGSARRALQHDAEAHLRLKNPSNTW